MDGFSSKNPDLFGADPDPDEILYQNLTLLSHKTKSFNITLNFIDAINDSPITGATTYSISWTQYKLDGSTQIMSDKSDLLPLGNGSYLLDFDT